MDLRHSSRHILPGVAALIAAAIYTLHISGALVVWALPADPVLSGVILLCVLAGLGLIAFPLDSQEAARQCGKLRLSRPLAAAILLALCCAFALLPMETFFYGDGGLLIPQIYLLSQGLEYDAGLLLNLKSSPLAGYLLVSTAEHAPDAYNLLGADLPETALYPFRWLSLIAFIPVGIMLLLEQDRKLALAQLLFVLGTAGSLFFFGYVEYYPLWFGLVTAFLLAGWQHMRSGKPLWLAVLWFVLAFAAHYATIALLPALLFIIFREHSFVTSLMAADNILVGVYFLVLAAAARARWLQRLLRARYAQQRVRRLRRRAALRTQPAPQR